MNTLPTILDISIFSLFVYFAIRFATRNMPGRATLVLAIAAAIYLLATRYDMPLTYNVLRYGFFICVFASVILYQDSIRGHLNRFSRWLFRTEGAAASNSRSVIDTLTSAVFRLAEIRTGALIVVRGHDDLKNIVEGGISLDGTVSAPLLYSIFDVSSPGHDGALVINNGIAERFATHLPLATAGRVPDHGTRHHAALGLSESSDALVIVVSEETGTVSVARNGQLTSVDHPVGLLEALQSFQPTEAPETNDSFIRSILMDQFWHKVAAVAVALVFWFSFHYDSSEVQRTFVVPIEYRNTPKSVKLTETLTLEARVTLMGSEKSFQFLAPSALVVSIDVKELAAGKRRFSITEENVRHPHNVSVSAVEPRSVNVSLTDSAAEKL